MGDESRPLDGQIRFEFHDWTLGDSVLGNSVLGRTLPEVRRAKQNAQLSQLGVLEAYWPNVLRSNSSVARLQRRHAALRPAELVGCRRSVVPGAGGHAGT